jgi:hypothetical protein
MTRVSSEQHLVFRALEEGSDAFRLSEVCQVGWLGKKDSVGDAFGMVGVLGVYAEVITVT